MRFLFTSDPHLGHGNIIKYCNRPFKDTEHMNREIISRWNKKVRHDDVVFVDGDFCFIQSSEAPDTKKKAKDWEKLLNGKIIHIGGNHDKNNTTKTCIQGMIIYLGGKRMYVVHNPKHANKNFSINLTGHIHEQWEIKRIGINSVAINIGMDVWDFTPITINEILSRYSKWLKIDKLKKKKK